MTQTKRRAPLRREQVLRAAVALADDRGSEGLTMRKLAKVLGVEAMSLYNHVDSKDDLLDGMVDIVFDEIEAPAAGGDWKAELRKRAASTREALERHRWAIGEMEGRRTTGRPNLRLHRRRAGVPPRSGLLRRDGRPRVLRQDAYIYGFALQQRDIAPETPEDFAAEAGRQMREYATALADFPHLVEVVGGYIAEAGYDYDAEFRFGLDLILDGLEQS
jgi:AcrR family transcriptional regulator